jgi:adenylate cyclase
MSTATASPLAEIEPRLRSLLPADLYAAAWLDPCPENLVMIFEHLRTLRFILYDYVPRQVAEKLPEPGEVRYEWQEGTLMFTDLAGFTPLMEANAARGSAGAETLLGVLNSYFSEMLEIISKSGGNLLEFTGDALLAVFPKNAQSSDAVQAVRAGLRMQRAMAHFANIETDQGTFSLRMRIGIHSGRFFTADIGAPRRMEHVLLGEAVHQTKRAESAGQTGRVCLTKTTQERIKDSFRFEPGTDDYMLVMDDLTPEELGEYELVLRGRRLPTVLLLDRSIEGLLNSIEESLKVVEILASFIPNPILMMLVENTARRDIPPDFPRPTVVFVNLIGLAEAVDQAKETADIEVIVEQFSRVLTLVNAAVEARGGVLKKVTYHLAGSDMMIFFGTPNAHTDDPIRAANAALAIRELFANSPQPVINGAPVRLACQIGIARGPAFSGEIGEPRGRREFNVLGDTINTAARLMARSAEGQILLTQAVYQDISQRYECESLGAVSLKGKSAPIPLFALHGLQTVEKVEKEKA